MVTLLKLIPKINIYMLHEQFDLLKPSINVTSKNYKDVDAQNLY